MIHEQYVWFVWSLAFLLPWLILYYLFPLHRNAMLWASLFTMPFGLTEPLFVPDYWSPSSLFNLARRTGFDIESLIFCFGIGGTAVVLYNISTGSLFKPVSEGYRHLRVHKYHTLALIAPFLSFPILYFFPWNPIYPGFVAMLIGTVATLLCRPDLKTKTWIGGLLFLGYYWVFISGLNVLSPGYIERVWNMDALSGIIIFEVPLEELVFALTFGMYWSGVYEHFTWKKTIHT
jgi:hypothetical protein